MKVTPDCKVKVLDFGLATAAEEEQTASTENSPTLTMRQTQLRVILGTAGYMALAQAQARATRSGKLSCARGWDAARPRELEDDVVSRMAHAQKAFTAGLAELERLSTLPRDRLKC